MGIFSRFRDIINSNLNSMLEKAEDPEKLIKLMIHEMEETLVELKASCAAGMASRTKVERTATLAEENANEWARKARLAVDKGREDLAREALIEKRRHAEEAQARKQEAEHFEQLVTQYKEDIAQLDEKLESARQKHRLLIQRHEQANKTKKSRRQIVKASNSDAFARFEAFENRIERMEAEAELEKPRANPSLHEQFEELENADEIEAELASLREECGKDKSRK